MNNGVVTTAPHTHVAELAIVEGALALVIGVK